MAVDCLITNNNLVKEQAFLSHLYIINKYIKAKYHSNVRESTSIY